MVVCLLGVRGGRGLSAGANVGRPFQQSGVLRDGPHALLHALHDVFQPHDKYLKKIFSIQILNDFMNYYIKVIFFIFLTKKSLKITINYYLKKRTNSFLILTTIFINLVFWPSDTGSVGLCHEVVDHLLVVAGALAALGDGRLDLLQV